MEGYFQAAEMGNAHALQSAEQMQFHYRRNKEGLAPAHVAALGRHEEAFEFLYEREYFVGTRGPVGLRDAGGLCAEVRQLLALSKTIMEAEFVLPENSCPLALCAAMGWEAGVRVCLDVLARLQASGAPRLKKWLGEGGLGGAAGVLGLCGPWVQSALSEAERTPIAAWAQPMCEAAASLGNAGWFRWLSSPGAPDWAGPGLLGLSDARRCALDAAWLRLCEAKSPKASGRALRLQCYAACREATRAAFQAATPEVRVRFGRGMDAEVLFGPSSPSPSASISQTEEEEELET